MRRMAVMILAVGLLAAVAVAGPKRHDLSIAMGAATGGTNITDGVSGYVEEVFVWVSDGVSTGAVTVAVLPRSSVSVASYNIATNSVTDEKRWRPVVERTSVAGVDLTGDEPARPLLVGDGLRFIVTGSPTNVTWRCRVKVDD